MSVCDELSPRAALVAALYERDPERIAYLAHAAGCATCARALHEAQRLLALLDAHPLPAPSAAVLARAAAPIRAELAASQAHSAAGAPAQSAFRSTSASPSVAGRALMAAAAAAAFLGGVAAAHSRDTAGFPVALVAAAVAAAIAALAGAPRLGILAAFAASLRLALVSADGAGLLPSVGVECLLLEQLGAALPLAAALWLARRGPPPSPLSLAQAAAAGALASQASLFLTCPARFASAHLWTFHVGGVALAALLGALLPPRLIRATARAR